MYVPVGIQWSGVQLRGYSWCCEGREVGLGLCLELTCNNIDLVSHVRVWLLHMYYPWKQGEVMALAPLLNPN